MICGGSAEKFGPPKTVDEPPKMLDGGPSTIHGPPSSVS
jgi:hypothetical protein